MTTACGTHGVRARRRSSLGAGRPAWQVSARQTVSDNATSNREATRQPHSSPRCVVELVRDIATNGADDTMTVQSEPGNDRLDPGQPALMGERRQLINLAPKWPRSSAVPRRHAANWRPRPAAASAPRKLPHSLPPRVTTMDFRTFNVVYGVRALRVAW